MTQDEEMTQKITPVKFKTEEPLTISETPIPSSSHDYVARVRNKRAVSNFFLPSTRDAALLRLIQEECRSFCLPLFFGEAPVRSLGITSSIPGEGKSFVAAMLAQVLAQDSTQQVLLVELKWEHSGLDHYLGCPTTPGIAEWLRGECTEDDIRYQIQDNLTFIPAGNDEGEAMKLVQKLRKAGLQHALAHNDENLLIELPPIMTTAYSTFAATLVDALALVVRAGVTPDHLITEACSYLSKLPMQGIILNQVEDHNKLRHSMRKNT